MVGVAYSLFKRGSDVLIPWCYILIESRKGLLQVVSGRCAEVSCSQVNVKFVWSSRTNCHIIAVTSQWWYNHNVCGSCAMTFTEMRNILRHPGNTLFLFNFLSFGCLTFNELYICAKLASNRWVTKIQTHWKNKGSYFYSKQLTSQIYQNFTMTFSIQSRSLYGENNSSRLNAKNHITRSQKRIQSLLHMGVCGHMYLERVINTKCSFFPDLVASHIYLLVNGLRYWPLNPFCSILACIFIIFFYISCAPSAEP